MNARWLTDIIARRMDRLRLSRAPDVVIGGGENPYMLRWFVIPRNRWLNIYHHVVVRDDDDRALHDHPWWSVSIILEGGMVEHYARLPSRADESTYWFAHFRRFLEPGRIVGRRAASAHRLELRNGLPCKTLFVTGPRIREWGFHCPKGWRHWRDFTGFNQTGDSTRIGPGCD
ncbi:hypothetical protein [Oceaniradius stylonematis]|uniref:hypothetical protein n=1 Tax=Oceaniradius stylonematis TaxID=2184161 RepID=UPI003B591687